MHISGVDIAAIFGVGCTVQKSFATNFICAFELRICLKVQSSHPLQSPHTRGSSLVYMLYVICIILYYVYNIVLYIPGNDVSIYIHSWYILSVNV